jgi:hypothetical protein
VGAVERGINRESEAPTRQRNAQRRRRLARH